MPKQESISDKICKLWSEERLKWEVDEVWSLEVVKKSPPQDSESHIGLPIMN